MRNIQRASNFFLCTAIFAAFAVTQTLSAATAEHGSAKVIRIEGAARVSDGSNGWRPLHVGDVLRPGMLIQTASRSQVDFVFGEHAGIVRAAAGTRLVKSGSDKAAAQQDVVRMTENTLLAIDKFLITKTGADVVKETELDLRAGKIFGSVKKLTGASKYEVKVPNGVAGIRGTVYSISASGVLSVWEGSVVLAIVGPGGEVKTQVVNAGQQFDPVTGQVSPIPPTDTRPDMVFEPVPRKVLYTAPDRTIYFVSPTLGAESPDFFFD